MMRFFVTLFLALAILLGTSSSGATEYNYEVGIDYSNSDSSGSLGFGSFGIVPSPGAVTTFSNDFDSLSLYGRWYYRQLDDGNGPRARAELISRASNLSLQYLATDMTTSLSTMSPGLPLVSNSTSADTRAITASLRHMFANDTWFLLVGLSRLDVESRFSQSTNVSAFDFDGTALALGIGGYIGQDTTLSFTISEAESPGVDPTTFALNLAHVGQMSSGWYYGVDLGASRSDRGSDEGNYQLGVAFYPNADIEFGVRYERNQVDFLGDFNSYELFGSWFVRPNIKLSAGYRDGDDANGSAIAMPDGGDQIRIGASIRF